MSLNPRIVKESFAQIELSADKAAAYFYGRLFAENPRLRPLFPSAMDGQRDRLFRALTRIVWSLDSPDTLATYLAQLGRDHRKFGVLHEHYAAVGQALIATLKRFSGDTWTAEVEEAWTAAYTTAASLMMRAAESDAENAPPWWIAEVVEHELRAPDIAVLTVRPGIPLDYAAGQYVSVQTARWPRVWRTFSVANAPRPDGLLRFHVRAVPAGWVSGSLVRHTKIGDTLLLGPAVGTMVLDPDSRRDLLCVAGGTGLAPLKAIVEQVADAHGGRARSAGWGPGAAAPSGGEKTQRAGGGGAVGPGQAQRGQAQRGQQNRRAVHLIFGARTATELYDLAELRMLEGTYPWLRVTPVVSDDPGFDGMHGTVPEVLGRFRGWDDHEVYIAGPMEMISKSVTALQNLGVPPDRIHHDPIDDHIDGE